VSFLRAWFPLLLPLGLALLWWWGQVPLHQIAAFLWVSAFVAALWVGWHRQQALRFRAWFREKRTSMPPLSAGIWEETFAEGYHWRRHQEITQRQLSAQIVQLRDALQAMPDAVILMDEDGRLLWVNPAAVQLLGLHWPDDLGKPFAYWLRLPQMRQFLGGEGSTAIQMPMPRDPERVVEGLRYPLGDAGALVLFRDITRLRQLEQVRQDFVANVSHELRSPLTVIRGFLENLLDGPLGRDAEVGPQLRLMETQSQRMQSLVEDLLSLARMESTEPDPQRLQELFPAELLRRSLSSLAPQIQEKALQLQLEVDEELAILAEPLDIQSIVHNLVDNAVKYSPAGRAIRVFWLELATELLFAVEDQGDGIAPEHLRRITERFYRVDRGRSRRVGGTGLGLAIVRHAVERYHGRLEIDSEPGHGSVFRVHFPQALGRRRKLQRDPEAQAAVIKVS